MYHNLFRNYRIISVMFWAFPYLLWQAFGHWSGFVVGVIVAIMLTVMLNDLFNVGCSHTLSSAGWRSFERAKPQPRDEEMQDLYPRKEMPPREVI